MESASNQVCMKRNLSDLRQDERRRSERRVNQASEAAQLGTLEWNIDRNEFWITGRGRELYGFSPKERIDFNRFLTALHPEDCDAVRDALTRSRDEVDGNYEQEYRVVLPNGRVRWIATRGQIGTSTDNNATLLRSISFDITERKQTEECFRLVVESTPNGMAMLNSDGRISLINSRMEKDFGYSRKELIGQSIEMLIHGFLRMVEVVDSDGGFVDVSADIVEKKREVIGLRKDGSEIPLEISLSSIPSLDGEVLAMITDISARKRTERELERQRNELAHLSRMAVLSELSGSLAHELNQPLAAILSNAQAGLRLLAHENPSLDEVRDILADIANDDRRAGEVIQGLHLLLKNGELRYEPFSMNDVVQSIARLVHSELLNAGVDLQTTLALDLPMVNGDRVQLQQVLLNLVVNGCEAMASITQKKRQVSVTTELRNDDCILVCVTDRGRGIPANDLERVFEPFFTTKADGLGLGLAVCRRIIAAHGGRLWAANNDEGGASFNFTVAADSGDAIER